MALKSENHRKLVGTLFFLPFFILFIIFTVLPVLISLVLSLTNFNMLQSPKFIGITNFKLLFIDDDVFFIALKNTFTFAFITGPIGYILSFLSAWVINQLKLKTGFAVVFYMPSITSGVAMSVIFLYFFSPDKYGLLNNLLINLGVITSPILWTISTQYIMTVIIIIQLWMSMGTGFLVFLAGLQNMPRDILEAGRIDGVKNRFQELQYIILPTMKPQLLYGAISTITASFAVFDIPVQIAGFPSPQYAAHTIIGHLYDYAFIRFEMGYASAIAFVLFVITFVLGRVVMNVLRSDY